MAAMVLWVKFTVFMKEKSSDMWNYVEWADRNVFSVLRGTFVAVDAHI